MESKIQFLNYLPEYYRFPYGSVFYDQKYLMINRGEIKSFCAVDHTSRKVVMVIHFELLDNKAISLLHAPFGGILINESVEPERLIEFIKYVISELQISRINQICIKEPPPFHKNAVHPMNLYKALGFNMVLTETNHHLLVDTVNLSNLMPSMQKRRLRKCVDSGFEVSNKPNGNLREIYEFILKCRKSRKHSISITYDKLHEVTQSLPNSYLLFGCYNQEQLIAATICVAVNTKVLYNYLPASDPIYDNYSPMVLLVNKIYQYCQDNKFEVFDLGTSMLDKEPNPGLITFKERLGGIASSRHNYQLDTTSS